MEMERTETPTIFPFGLENTIVMDDYQRINFEVLPSYEAFYNLEIENNIPTLLTNKPLEVEYNTFINTDYEINYEFYRYDFNIYPMAMELLGKRKVDYDLNFEFNRVYHQNYDFNIEVLPSYEAFYELNNEFFGVITDNFYLNNEYKVTTVDVPLNYEFINIYIDDYTINNEFDIPNLTTEYILDQEVSIPTLDKIYPLNYEFNKVYHQNYNLNNEYTITELSHDFTLDKEILVKLKTDQEVNYEFIRPRETTKNLQTYIIPFGYLKDNFQVYVLAVSDEYLNMELNVPDLPLFAKLHMEHNTEINMNYVLDYEVSIPTLNKLYDVNQEVSIPTLNKDIELNHEIQVVYHDIWDFQIEQYTEINMDYNIDTEVSIPTLNKNYPLNYELYTKLDEDYEFNTEVNTVINNQYFLNIETFIDELSHNYNLDLENYVEINKSFPLDIEMALTTLSRKLNLEIEILDLVYYFIRKGYNILPWTYSDGLGNFDSTINKNWDKNNPQTTTLENGFINQLQHKNITVPSTIRFSDKSLENFGTIIKGTIEENIELSDKFLYYENIDDNHVLVMGKRKKEPQEIVNLKKGNNLIIWDGPFSNTNPPTFNSEILPQISDEFNFASLWDQVNGVWNTIDTDNNKDHPLYFTMNIDGTEQPMPYIINLNVKNDISFTIYR